MPRKPTTSKSTQVLPESLESRYNLLGATGETLTTLGTVQVGILSDRKVWPTPAIEMSSLTHPLILELNFLKLTKSKVDFEINTVETGSKLYPTDTIVIPKSDVYWPCQILLKKKACWMTALMLTIVIILTAVASHTHYFNTPFKNC